MENCKFRIFSIEVMNFAILNSLLFGNSDRDEIQHLILLFRRHMERRERHMERREKAEGRRCTLLWGNKVNKQF